MAKILAQILIPNTIKTSIKTKTEIPKRKYILI
jgi:hypothetical protein